MARIDNATVMQCDRCGKNKWYKDLDDPDIKTWYNTIRLDADGKNTATCSARTAGRNTPTG